MLGVLSQNTGGQNINGRSKSVVYPRKLWFQMPDKNDNYTIMIVPQHSHAQMLQVELSRKKINLFVGITAFLMFFTAVLLFNYHTLKQDMLTMRPLNEELKHKNKILNHLQEVQGKELEALSSTIDKLRQFDKKIRILTGLEANKDGNSKLDGAGVGGKGGPTFGDAAALDKAIYNTYDGEMDLVDVESLNEYQSSLYQAKFAYNQMRDLVEYLTGRQEELESTPSLWPLEEKKDGWVSSQYGMRTSLFTGEDENHLGIDIVAQEGTNIVATADGRVTQVRHSAKMGKELVIENDFGYKIRYAHCQSIKVKVGQRVTRGMVVATLGNTGKTADHHLHYEVVYNSLSVDPAKYIILE